MERIQSFAEAMGESRSSGALDRLSDKLVRVDDDIERLSEDVERTTKLAAETYDRVVTHFQEEPRETQPSFPW
ncbi:MAG: hypothetical protein H6729_16045 [Deltaproteobacteria bacterium]|nr:hypothetical protein [Deltaproteobacteria bacterium]